MISIIGLKNAGKTTFLVALAAELVRRKFRVMTIKHGSHQADMDQKGKDTWRHWHEGKAERVLMEAPGQRVLFEHTERESDPISLARTYLRDADIVLVEGFKRQPIPKLEIHRAAAARPLLFRHDEHIVAIATDEPIDTTLPQFGLEDYDPIAEFILVHLGLPGEVRQLCMEIP